MKHEPNAPQTGPTYEYLEGTNGPATMDLVLELERGGTGHVKQPQDNHTVLTDPLSRNRKNTLVERETS